jgi:hypothetical protein
VIVRPRITRGLIISGPAPFNYARQANACPRRAQVPNNAVVLILALEYSPNGPKYFHTWRHDANRDGTEAELAENRQVLSELKAWLSQHKQNWITRNEP